ncbi:hypothetical protein [Streptomyces netropsis]|uniref:Uncharacterized protein n=1 Tax=Streptomyces netropsis TaxID=55404 RepID=A0A7W7LHN1_STRNE|nr:hypothetical protein [Streptomyces netropsis]MBB4890410.1 hypothetical protein [Streptomyces netropsis]GGR46139.1 hypothetical protein GCM10010219_59690 [Streptomyces netropsis]
MTDHHETHERDRAADRWLDQHQCSLLEDLNPVLDVEAGLREILLQSRHDTLVDDLDSVLDVGAGLAAILPSATPAPDLQSPTSSADEDLVSAEFPLSVSPQIRLTLRTNPDITTALRAIDHARNFERVVGHAGQLARHLICILESATDPQGAIALNSATALNSSFDSAGRIFNDLARTLDGATDLTRRLGIAFDRASFDRASAFNHACTVVRNLDGILGPASLYARDPDRALTLALASTIHLVRYLDDARGLPLVYTLISKVRRIISEALGRELPVLDVESVATFLNDFTTSDLRTTDLKGVDLTGVRWSESGTHWPDAMDVEGLKKKSQETPAGSGVWVVRSGTGTAPTRDFAELT